MNYITRYGPPSKLDQAPFGTACKVNHTNEFDIYFQMSHDETEPKWIIISTFPIDTPEEELLKSIHKIIPLKQ